VHLTNRHHDRSKNLNTIEQLQQSCIKGNSLTPISMIHVRKMLNSSLTKRRHQIGMRILITQISKRLNPEK